jgi:hypothetical protein
VPGATPTTCTPPNRNPFAPCAPAQHPPRPAGSGARNVHASWPGSYDQTWLRDRIAALVPDARRVEGDLFGSIRAGLARDALRKFG